MEYTEGIIKFRCDSCNFMGELDIRSSLEDNCVLDVDVVCELCGDSYVFYLLKCKDEFEAERLHGKLKALKIKHRSEY
jgi:hypothetical protein